MKRGILGDMNCGLVLASFDQFTTSEFSSDDGSSDATVRSISP